MNHEITDLLQDSEREAQEIQHALILAQAEERERKFWERLAENRGAATRNGACMGPEWSI